METDSIGNTTNTVFRPVTNTTKVQKTPNVKKDGEEPGSDDPTNEQHKDSEKKRHSKPKPKPPIYRRDGKLGSIDPHGELDEEPGTTVHHIL